jgi:hypothetical protein
VCVCVCLCVWCRYGMSSIYPMTMAWPASAGLLLDPKSTTHLVIGGCVGEALVPVVIGELMRVRHRHITCTHIRHSTHHMDSPDTTAVVPCLMPCLVWCVCVW